MGPHGLLVQAAAPVGGGKAWPGFETDHSEPKARVWRSRGRAAAHGRTKQPGPATGAQATGLRPPLRPLREEPSHATRLQLGALEAEDVKELARTIR